MKEFPSQETLSFLAGRRVSNVIFQPYSIDITFDDNSYLVAEHIIEHVDQRGVHQTLNPQKGFECTSLHKIVDRLVTSIEREPLSLTLHLENGHSVKIVSILGPFESGHIWRGKELYVY